MKSLIVISGLLFSFYSYGDMKEVYLKSISQSLAYLVADRVYDYNVKLCDDNYSMKIVLAKTSKQKLAISKEWKKCFKIATNQFNKDKEAWK